MLPSRPLSAPLTAAHFHGEALHFRLRLRRHIGHRHMVEPLMPEFPATTWAYGDRHRNFHRRFTVRRSGRGATVSKGALSCLAARPFALCFSLALPARLAAPCRFQFLAQLIVLLAQPVDFLIRLFQARSQLTNFGLTLFQLFSKISARSAFHYHLS